MGVRPVLSLGARGVSADAPLASRAGLLFSVRMDLNALLMLADVAAAGSLAEAARKTGVSKSTLSRKLAQLEDEVGVRLFERTARRFGLTGAGRRLVESARRASTEISGGLQAVRALGDAPAGTLRIATSVSLCEHFLSPVVLKYIQRYPEVDVQLLLGPEHRDLIEEGVDLAVRAAVPDPTGSLIVRRLAETSFGLVASAAYLDARGTPETPADLAGHDGIVYQPASLPHPWVLEDSDQNRVEATPRCRVTLNSLPMALRAAEAGLGIAAVPDLFAQPAIETGTVAAVLPGWRSPSLWMCVAFPSRKHHSAAVRAFVEMAVAHFGSQFPTPTPS